nr:MAG TPA: hypothetical protein [Bacteriophage sp.]
MEAMPDFTSFIKAETSIRKKIKQLKIVKHDNHIDKWIARGQYVI